MGKKKHTFTTEEKELIHQMKAELQMMGVPKDQWSIMIQDALKAQQKLKKFTKKREKEAGLGGAIQRVRGKIEEKVQKVISKKYGMGGSMDELFGDIGEETFKEGMEFMNNLLFGAPPDIKNISDHGTFLGERPDKKRMIVHFDDEEE